MNEDHDLLIELRSEVKGIRADIIDLKDNIKSQVSDHEDRLRVCETDNTTIKSKITTWGSIATIGLALLEIALRFFFK